MKTQIFLADALSASVVSAIAVGFGAAVATANPEPPPPPPGFSALPPELEDCSAPRRNIATPYLPATCRSTNVLSRSARKTTTSV